MYTASYIDIHTHLRREGVLCLVSYGLGRDNIPSDPGGPFSAGIHPWDAGGITSDMLENYTAYLMDASIQAVGEIGLDYMRGGDRERQKYVFKAQLDIAAQRSLPVIVHCVRAFNDLFPLLRLYPGTPFILHGYTGSPELTSRVMEAGCYFSLGERSIGSAKTVMAFEKVPVSRIFAETDDSDISIEHIYKRIAEIKNTDVEELMAVISDNYKKIFGHI